MVNYPDELISRITDPMLKHMHTKTDNLTWEHVQRIRDAWPGNLLIKGLQSAEDAVIAKERGLQGVVLSNHGGRYVDSAPAPLQVVAETRKAVGNNFTVIIDSGARRGSDLVKAIACGADLVMSGGQRFGGLRWRVPMVPIRLSKFFRLRWTASWRS